MKPDMNKNILYIYDGRFHSFLLPFGSLLFNFSDLTEFNQKSWPYDIIY